MVKKNYDDMLSRFHLIPERHGQTDGQTERIAISISRTTDFFQMNPKMRMIGNWTSYYVATLL